MRNYASCLEYSNNSIAFPYTHIIFVFINHISIYRVFYPKSFNMTSQKGGLCYLVYNLKHKLKKGKK